MAICVMDFGSNLMHYVYVTLTLAQNYVNLTCQKLN